ncbi:hypothetical protein QE152_g24829 [Popillia japonica]|uniref:Gag protein n=1 Tax=Popillia japonica TaxID=7064 RepID=A0AAW1K261_POPJA
MALRQTGEELTKTNRMEYINQPKPMVQDGDVGKNWKRFKNNWNLYATATGCIECGKEVQAATFLHIIGEETRDILETLELTEIEMKDVNAIILRLDNYFLPKLNMEEPRRSYEFGVMKDELITDRIVCGIIDGRTKEKLLREPKLNLTKAINICKSAEQADVHILNLTKAINICKSAEQADVHIKQLQEKRSMEVGRITKERTQPNTSHKNWRERNRIEGEERSGFRQQPRDHNRNQTWRQQGQGKPNLSGDNVQQLNRTNCSKWRQRTAAQQN